MKSYEECCVECQEQNPFFKAGGSLVGRFAYTRDTPFIQPFESIKSPWTDYIKSDSLETNIKKLYKLAQKYAKSQKEKDKKAEEEKPKETPKEKEKPKEEEKPEQETSTEKSADKEKDKEELALSRTAFLALKSQWNSLCSRESSKRDKNAILVLASELGVTNQKGKGYALVHKNLMGQLNKIFKTSYN
jgi:hypothetical protein